MPHANVGNRDSLDSSRQAWVCHSQWKSSVWQIEGTSINHTGNKPVAWRRRRFVLETRKSFNLRNNLWAEISTQAYVWSLNCWSKTRVDSEPRTRFCTFLRLRRSTGDQPRLERRIRRVGEDPRALVGKWYVDELENDAPAQRRPVEPS